ncbi:MAG TPA: type II toxin-antitoxin system HicB family antitoxin [Mycobacterium sp.]
MCLEFPGLHAIALTPHEAIEHVQELVGEILAEYTDGNMDPPKSLTDHTYSGQFTVRTSPELHERLTVEAAEQGVSMNQWVAYKLAGRRIPTLDDLF